MPAPDFITPPYYPDAIARPSYSLAMAMVNDPSFFAAPKPERTRAIAAEFHPDRAPRPLRAPTEQFFASIISPPARTAADTTWWPRYPDSAPLSRPFAATQLFQPGWVPLTPVKAGPGDSWWAHVGPEIIQRPALAIAQHPSQAGELTLQPSPFAPGSVGLLPGVRDYLPRPPALAAANQQAASAGIVLSPIPRLPSDTQWQPTYPAALPLPRVRESLWVSVSATAPERSGSIVSTPYPDQILGRILHASAQPFLIQQPNPSPTALLVTAFAEYPDAAPGRLASAVWMPWAPILQPAQEAPYPLAWQSPGATVVDRPGRAYILASSVQAFVLQALPDTHPLPAITSYPDAAPGRAVPAALQFSVLALNPKGEAAGYILRQHDDFARGVKMPVSEMLAFATSPAIEQPFPLAASARYQDAVSTALRSVFFPFSSVSELTPDRTSIAVFESHADAVPGALRLGTGLNPSAPTLHPVPERTAVPAFESHADAAPGALRPTTLAAFFWTSQQPDRSSVLAAPAFPDSATRPFLSFGSHLAVTGLAPAPEVRAPLDWSTQYPDVVRGSSIGTGSHLATSLPPSPIPDIPLRWAPSFADFAPGRFAHASQAPYASSWVTIQIGQPGYVIVTLVASYPVGETLPVTFVG
jgi:hypothetical protein